MTTTTTAAQAFRRLAFLEKVLGPTLQQAQADQAQADAAERQRLLAQRNAELRAAQKRHELAVKAREAAEAKAAAALSAHRAARDDWERANLEAMSASNAVDRVDFEFSARLAGLGTDRIEATANRINTLRLHAASKARWVPTSKLGAAGFHATGKVEVLDPSPLHAYRTAEAAAAELEALRFDPKVTPAEIDRRCSQALERVLDAGGRATWQGFETHTIDMSEFRKWQLRTTEDRDIRSAVAAAAAKEG